MKITVEVEYECVPYMECSEDYVKEYIIDSIPIVIEDADGRVAYELIETVIKKVEAISG